MLNDINEVAIIKFTGEIKTNKQTVQAEYIIAHTKKRRTQEYIQCALHMFLSSGLTYFLALIFDFVKL